MSVTAANERHQIRDGDQTEDKRNYTRTWQVFTNDKTDSAAVVLAYSTIPNIKDSFPGDVQSRLVRRRAIPDEEESMLWIVTCRYETESQIGAGEDDPTNEDPQVSFTGVQYDVVVDKAYQSGDTVGNPTRPVVNSAKDEFDPPITQPESRTLVTIKQNLSGYNPLWSMEYENTINNGKITIVGIKVGATKARMVKIDAIFKTSPNPNSTRDYEYYEVVYQIELNKRGYRRAIADIGFYHIDAADSNKKKHIRDDKLLLISEPWKLDGDDGNLQVDQNADPQYIEFQTYWEASWTSLNIPRNMP